MPYELKKGDLFEVPTKAILTHACNAKGVWGRGIAATFKQKYPKAFYMYRKYCIEKTAQSILGEAYIANDEKPIGCLITSWDYYPPDPPSLIAMNTEQSAYSLIRQVEDTLPDYEIHSCKINAGLFKVPWQKSEDAILKALRDSGDNIKWVVWEL